MSTVLNPYINFADQAREAITFYHSVFGGELTIGTFGEFGAVQDPADADLIMHSQLSAPNGITLMASDTPAHVDHTPGNNITISLSGSDEAELRGYWDGLSAGGTVGMPLETAVWGDTFGMFTDKFGINWVVNIAGSQA